METVAKGTVVQVHYTGTLKNGEVFDSSQDREPLEVAVGEGQLIMGFEKALLGMSVNEKKVFTLSPEEAYGERNADALRTFSRQEIPPGLEVEKGQMVAVTTPQGEQIPAKVIQVDDENLTIDFNHPLAGETLTFEIEVVGIHS
ncbi:MAG: peptidylprolyl isomerase [Desulfobacteraceae bacterium]|nr:MAG: peptidylprolyl isomerase [Desulfobacteraceae bacterium]